MWLFGASKVYEQSAVTLIPATQYPQTSPAYRDFPPPPPYLKSQCSTQ